MKKPRVKSYFGALIVAFVCGLGAGLASAAPDQEEASRPAREKPWWQWVAGTGFIIGVLIPTFKDPKRGHR